METPKLYADLADWWPLLSAPADHAEEAAIYRGLLIVDGGPEPALLPFAVRADFRAVYVQASGLARHSRGADARRTDRPPRPHL